MNAPAKAIARIGHAPAPRANVSQPIDYAAVIRKAAAPLKDVRFAERAYTGIVGNTALFNDEEAGRYVKELINGKLVVTAAGIDRLELKFREILSRLPDVKDLRLAEGRVTQALSVSATDAHFALIAGVLTDCFRAKAGEEAAIFADMLASVFEFLPEQDDEDTPMPLAAVASATLELMASMKFRPSISEIVEKSREHRTQLSRAQYMLRRMARAIEFAEEWFEDADVARPLSYGYVEAPNPFADLDEQETGS